MSHVIEPFTALGGYLYNPRLVYAPNRYLPLALQGLIPYNNHNYQPRYYTAPPDPRVAIAAGSTVDTQLRIIPGSVIVGARFATLAGADPSQILYLLRDSNTQQNFTDGRSRYLNCKSLVPTGPAGLPFCMFPKPYTVTAPQPDGEGHENSGGVIVVSLSNNSTANDIKCQMLLVVLEPTQIVTDAETGSIMVPRSGAEQGAAA